ncbi:tol-pal system YbgF family protein [bacterium]
MENKAEIVIGKFIDWAKENKDQFIITIATLIFIIILIPILFNHYTKKTTRTWTLYAQLENNYYNGKLDESIKLADQILHENKRGFATKLGLFMKANAYYHKEDYTTAINLFTEFLTKHKDHYLSQNAIYSRAYAYEMIKDYENAINNYNHLINLYPTSYLLAEAYHNKARAYELHGNIRSALEAYKLTSTLYPKTIWQEKAKVRISHLQK